LGGGGVVLWCHILAPPGPGPTVCGPQRPPHRPPPRPTGGGGARRRAVRGPNARDFRPTHGKRRRGEVSAPLGRQQSRVPHQDRGLSSTRGRQDAVRTARICCSWSGMRRHRPRGAPVSGTAIPRRCRAETRGSAPAGRSRIESRRCRVITTSRLVGETAPPRDRIERREQMIGARSVALGQVVEQRDLPALVLAADRRMAPRDRCGAGGAAGDRREILEAISRAG